MSDNFAALRSETMNEGEVSDDTESLHSAIIQIQHMRNKSNVSAPEIIQNIVQLNSRNVRNFKSPGLSNTGIQDPLLENYSDERKNSNIVAATKKKNNSARDSMKGARIKKLKEMEMAKSMYQLGAKLPQRVKREMINSSLRNTSSNLRIRCFRMRKNFILHHEKQFLAAFLTGLLFLLPCLISLIIIHQKFYDNNKQYLGDVHTEDVEPVVLNFSSSITPLLISSSVLCTLIGINMVALFGDLVNHGLFVWSRDNFGLLIQYFILHFTILQALQNIKEYIMIKETTKIVKPEYFYD